MTRSRVRRPDSGAKRSQTSTEANADAPSSHWSASGLASAKNNHSDVASPDRVGGVAASPLLEEIPTALVESMRYLIGRFQLGDHSEFPARLAVTSALHAEGVTTVSRTLAAIVANDLNIETCWMDLSWRTPRGGGEASGPAGISDILSDRVPLDDALRRIADSRLTILPGGTLLPGQREAFSRSPRLADVIEELAVRFAAIIFDIPPILAGSTGIGQIRHADSYLLVVRHGVTSVQQVRAATDQLQAIPSLGVVLNQFKTKIPKRLTHFFAS